MYFLRNHSVYGYSLEAIGKLLGYHHTSVLHHCKSIDDLLKLGVKHELVSFIEECKKAFELMNSSDDERAESLDIIRPSDNTFADRIFAQIEHAKRRRKFWGSRVKELERFKVAALYNIDAA